MKNLLLLFLLVSFTSLFAQQNNIVYLRAHNASMGVRQDEYSPVTEWIVEGREVNILVELHQTKVIIYSNTTQNYYVINQVENGDDSKKWLCRDKDGNSCYVAMYFNKDYPNLITFAVEYNDLVWFYICSRE